MTDSDNKGNVTVGVRIKPLDAADDRFGLRPVESQRKGVQVQLLGGNSIRRPLNAPLTVCAGEKKTFLFDYVHWSTGSGADYPEYATQERVYEGVNMRIASWIVPEETLRMLIIAADLGRPLVKSAACGFHCTMFAYGQVPFVHAERNSALTGEHSITDWIRKDIYHAWKRR
jgi:hypothetical protein